jgi:serpin B
MTTRLLAILLTCGTLLGCSDPGRAGRSDTRDPSAAADLPPTPPTREQARLFADSTNAFAMDLWRELRSSAGGASENQVLSPASIAIALDMALGGARGETAAQVQHVLHLTDARAIHEAASNVLSTWNDPARDAYTLAVANRLFGERSFSFEPSFLELTRRRYGAPLEGLDFAGSPESGRNRINDWVASRTRDRIRDLLPEGAVNTSTRLVLTNAVYFLARWQTPFEPSLTRPAPFFAGGSRQLEVPTMRQRVRLPYGEHEGVQLVELPYEGGELAMMLALPTDRGGLPQLEAQLSSERLAAWVAALANRPVQVALPKFRVAPGAPTRLSQPLGALGMPLAFTRGAADFTGIANPPRPEDRLYVSEVFHKAFVQVDEEGTEAAAATAIAMEGGGARRSSTPVEFTADHPFLFLIRAVSSGTILFMGRVVDPS